MAAGSDGLFPKNTEQLLNCHFNGNVAALARFLAVNRYSVLAWKVVCTDRLCCHWPI
jgi:hypothetical protein